jgi:hypothetical protein
MTLATMAAALDVALSTSKRSIQSIPQRLINYPRGIVPGSRTLIY